ncbi:MAG TPA: EamA family transporter, partial [Opitutaceae bacterium]|nr:EamA family transporter [Opitutaceae bacterium]
MTANAATPSATTALQPSVRTTEEEFFGADIERPDTLHQKQESGKQKARAVYHALYFQLAACVSVLIASSAVDANTHRPMWKTLSAFAIIYFVWGSTFFAIRIGVREVPPFLLAAIRFLVAGFVLYGWTIAQGERSPNIRQWASVCLLAFLIFLVDYGLLFWAEQRVPSGIAAIMMATIPAFMALSEVIFLRTQKLTVRLALALLIGLSGVTVVVSRSLDLGGPPIDRLGTVALLVAAMSWSIASVFARILSLPPSKVMSSGAQ